MKLWRNWQKIVCDANTLAKQKKTTTAEESLF